MDSPLFENDLSVRRVVRSAGVGTATGHAPSSYARAWSDASFGVRIAAGVDGLPLCDDLVAVAWVNLGIAIAVEHDRRNGSSAWHGFR